MLWNSVPSILIVFFELNLLSLVDRNTSTKTDMQRTYANYYGPSCLEMI
jgi:hypothetical protein